MEIDSSDNSNWLIDYGIVEAIPLTGTFDWPSQSAFTASSNESVKVFCSFGDSDMPKEVGSRKRLKPEPCSVSGSKACREKLQFDMIARFLELCSILEPGRPPKTDKGAILIDAVRMVTQLRSEAQKLRESNEELQVKIKELKAEKNELRDEKQRLKADKEKLEQQVEAMSPPTIFLPHHSTMSAALAAQSQAALAAQSQAAGNKLMPFMGYPGVSMWQFMPPAAVDTSNDHVLRPPVA
ncbi:hypothetical protein Patl1_02077 [Pistacia atlantica]|uniref:Uncharacterized protein n=1 Tax=Pistacia atlantica TaxID=434234 RepID=A0ACC1C6Q9_9ROSI|nr:hypothetical protein Patl1_02077 [Pistacia atlantica]